MVLQEVQYSFTPVPFNSDRHEFVSRRPLRRVHAECILAFPHVVDVCRQFRGAALEILMQQTSELIEQINVCTAVYVLVESLWLVERRLILRNGAAGKRFDQKALKSFLGNSRGIRARSVVAER